MSNPNPDQEPSPVRDDVRYSYPLSYKGNLFWLVLFLIIFPPLGLLLLLLNGCIKKEGVCYFLEYRGDKFWLYFWTIIFFPIAIILGAIHGFDVVGEKL